MFQVTLITFYENVTNGKLSTLSSSLRTYLFAIGKYKILRDKKKGIMYANLDDVPDINLLGNDDDGYTLELEQQTKVHAALAKLGGDCQKLLELFYFQELCMADIAMALNYKNDNVAKVKKANCMRKLASIFKAS
jgi:DNA-directed RNA polymerase specialized sigma24 family protein